MKKVRTSISRKIVIILLSIVMITPNFQVSAQTETEKGSSKADFIVKTVRNEHQLDDEASYFHLPTNKNYTDVPLEIEITNNSDENVEFQVTFHIAKTNENGLISYGEKAYGPNESLFYNIEEHVEIEKPVRVVKAKSTDVVKIKVDTNNIKTVDGILMGAFRVRKTNEVLHSDAIGNTFAYQIGLVLTDDLEGKMNVSTELEYKGFELNVEVGRKKLRYFIDNNEANMTEKLKVVARLVSKKNDKVVLEKTMDEVVIAPNGTFSHYLDWDKYDVKPGEYSLEIEAKGTATLYSWEDDVVITDDKAKEMNEESLNKIVVLKEQIIISLIMLVFTLINHVLLLRKKGLSNEKTN